MRPSTVQDENAKKYPAKPFNNQLYEEIPPESVMVSRWLSNVWEKLGKPPDPFSETGGRLMNLIIRTWETLYPTDARLWLQERDEYRKAEKPISEQVSKHTGRSIASFPYPVFRMMRVVFPTFKATERKNCMKMVRRWSLFQMANKI